MARKTTILNKRELIIASARNLFSHYGFEKTTIDDIAKTAGIGKGTIYSEFGSKEEIMLSVITEFMYSVNQKIKEYIDNTEVKSLDTLRNLLIQRILMYYDHAKTYFHGAEIFTFPLNNMSNRDKINLETEEIIADLLQKIELREEKSTKNDYLKTAKTIRKALISLHPPLVLQFKNKEEIINEANDLLDLILAGFRVEKQIQERL